MSPHSTSLSPQLPPPPPDDRWRAILPSVVIVLLLVSVIFLGIKYFRPAVPPTPDPTFVSSSESFEKPAIVEVSGRVKKPGVYELPFNARVYQAIEKAGGVLPDADLSSINRAAWVEDGSKIIIPAKAAPEPKSTFSLELPENPLDKSTFETPLEAPLEVPRSTSAEKKSTATHKSTKPSPTKELPTQPIDLNRAHSADLQRLPGIGPAMAGRILQYRKEKGGFTTVDDLDGVKGIGPKTLEKLRPYVTVKPLPSQTAATDTTAP